MNGIEGLVSAVEGLLYYGFSEWSCGLGEW